MSCGGGTKAVLKHAQSKCGCGCRSLVSGLAKRLEMA